MPKEKESTEQSYDSWLRTEERGWHWRV